MQGGVSVDALLAAGRYAEAAAELRRLGDLERAQSLYEQIWDFRQAAEVARERGDRPALLRLLLDAKEPAEAARVGRELEKAAPVEQARAADLYERRRLWAEAAGLREALGQLTEARDLYRKAQLPLEAARLEESLGRSREAGLLYEKFLADEPSAPEAARAHFELGRLLAAFGRTDEAVRHLQKVTGEVELVTRARRLLVCELAALGYRDGAGALLDRLRKQEPDLPPLDAFILAERRAALEGARGREARLAGRYLVSRLLGAGGMGRVYLARDALSGKEVAVKVVAPPLDPRLREGYRRFVREARIISSLAHPNLVGVIAFHQELGILAMEYLSGGTLADRRPGPLSSAAVRAVLLEIAAGLEAAHAHGVIHRDLKPTNIFFSASGEAKLGDFGVAHLQDVSTTQTAGFIGTLAYMSPEQISGAPLTFACDLYALGVTAFEMLTGRLPFLGPDFVSQHLAEAAPRPSSLRPPLHPSWDALVARALAKAPDARFASLEEFRREVIALGADLPISADGNWSGVAVAPAGAPTPARAESRYSPSGDSHATGVSTLERATDAVLGREVMIEHFSADYVQSEAGVAHLRWLRAMARHGGPRLQRVLRIEAQAGGLRVVYEGVDGRPIALADLDAAGRARLLAALVPLHDAGFAHGQIGASLVREDWGETLLVVGRGPSRSVSTPDDDRRALGWLP